MPSFFSRHSWLLAALALALLVASGRLAIIAHYGSDLPYEDQWAAETNAFVIPLGEGNFGPAKLFLPTNEHRICFTLFTNAALFVLSGQWDARQQMVVNALLYAALFAGVWYSLARPQGRWWPALTFLLVAAAGGLPVVSENEMCGFQSQFFFVSGFSLYCLFRLLGSPVGSWQWHTGWLAGICAMLSLGSGFLAPLVVLVVIFAQIIFGGFESFRRCRATLIAASLLLAFGWLVHARAPAETQALHAGNARQFFTYLLAGLAWPATDLFWLGFVVYTPGLWLAWLWCRRISWRDRCSTYIGAGIFWVLLQAAGLAYSRSNTTMWPPANRYGDLYLYGLIFNAAAVILLLERPELRRQRWGIAALLLALLSIFGIGATRATRHALTEWLPKQRTAFRSHEKTIAAYLVTHDAGELDRGTYPYPVRSVMVFMLDNPAIRPHLPASVLGESRNNSGGRRASLLSCAASGVSRAWPIIAGLGAIFALLAIGHCLRSIVLCRIA